jgi:hypothetical protein
MPSIRSDSIAVIFVSQRNEHDEAGYRTAAPARQPYPGMPA